MLVFPSLAVTLLVFLPTLGGGVATWVLPSWWAKREGWRPSARGTLESFARGPVLASLFAVACWGFDILLWQANPGGLPPLLAPSSIAVIAELVVVWAAVAAASLAVRRHLISGATPSGRYLQYGVFSVGLLAVVLVLLSSPVVPRISGGLWALIGFGAGLLVTYLAVHVLNIVVERYLGARAHQQPGLETIYRFLRRVLLLVVALGGVAVSTYANFPGAAGAATSLILAAGFLSIVVGLAAQSTLANVIAGAMVSLAQPFKIGDAVTFNGEWCVVEDIRLTFTVLRTWDLRRLMVPNALFQSNVVVNYSAVDPTMLVIVPMQISYESDVDRARQIMAEEAQRHPAFLRLGELPVTHVMEYQDSGVLVRLLSAAKDQPTAFQVEKDLLYSIRKRFSEVGIEIPYPTRRVLLDDASRARVGGTRAPERSG